MVLQIGEQHGSNFLSGVDDDARKCACVFEKTCSKATCDGAKPLVLYSVAAGVHYVIVAPSGEMLSTGCNGSVDAAWLDACTYLLKPRLVEYLL
jgi:hypothetical protein